MATITLNRPEKMNASHDPMAEELLKDLENKENLLIFNLGDLLFNYNRISKNE